MRKFEFVNRILNNEDGLTRRLPERSTKNSAGYDFFNHKTVPRCLQSYLSNPTTSDMSLHILVW